MSLREELQAVWEDVDLRHLLGWREAILLGLFVAICVAALLVMIYHGHVEAIAGPSDIWIADPSFEWPVPVGSPEIGVRPDGSVGSINPFGRISSV